MMLTEVLGDFFWGSGLPFEAFSIVCRTTRVVCLVLLWTGGVALAEATFRFTYGAFFWDAAPCFFKGLGGTFFCLEDFFDIGILKARKNVFQRFVTYLFPNCNCAGSRT